jgi:hypothetical protein
MGEGVDPTQMCQSLVDKVAQSKQLMAITDPEILALFEDWLEELENEVVALVRTHGQLKEDSLAARLGLSRRGATFLLKKLRNEKKL